MRMRNVCIGLSLESIIFVLLTFFTYYEDQTIIAVFVWREFTHRGVGLGFCNFGEVVSDQSIVLSFFVVFELVLSFKFEVLIF